MGTQFPQHGLEGLDHGCPVVMWERIDENFELCE
jgi:hypothetical protein